MNTVIKLSLIVLILSMAACSPSTQEQKDNQTVLQQQQIYAQTQPVPQYDFSVPRETLIQIYDFKNKAISTYTVFFSYVGPVFVCPSKGYPIEGGTELTNPQQLAYYNSGSSTSTTIAQADPDGLYHPSTSAGTYVLCVRQNGDVVPVYAEPEVMTFPFPVSIVNNRIVPDDSAPSAGTIKINANAKRIVIPTPKP